ncbi:MAG: Lrp/AsnC family transcriptional regulator [Candidatus Hodarchaeales archaeon]|jgi:DNA-binding Lrp family transcriptional regulator
MNIEKLIIAELQQNSRLSYRQLSERLNHSTTTISSKIKGLEESGVIKKYTLQVDHEKLGYGLTAIITVTVSAKLTEIEEMISQMPGVVAVYDVTGSVDIIVLAKFKETNELSEMVKSLLDHENIERTNTMVALNIVKEDFALAPLDVLLEGQK